MITHEISINLPRDKLVVMATLGGLSGPWVRIIGTRLRVSPGIPCLVCHMSSGGRRAAYHTPAQGFRGVSSYYEQWESATLVSPSRGRQRAKAPPANQMRRSTTSSIMCDSVPEEPMQ